MSTAGHQEDRLRRAVPRISGLSEAHPNPGVAASSKEPYTITKAHDRHSGCAQKLKLRNLKSRRTNPLSLMGEDPGDKVPGVGTGFSYERHRLVEAMRPFNLQNVN